MFRYIQMTGQHIMYIIHGTKHSSYDFTITQTNNEKMFLIILTAFKEIVYSKFQNYNKNGVSLTIFAETLLL